MTRRILIAGCGDVGCALGTRLAAMGDQVWGLRRNVDALPTEIRPIAADLTADLPPIPPSLDAVVFAAAAPQRTDDAYRATYVEGLERLVGRLSEDDQRPSTMVFTSSTGVYGQDDGSWVDEDSPTEPTAFTGRRMVEAETVLAEAPWPTVAVRFGGIYGPGRTRLIERLCGEDPVPRSPPVWTNRIHRDDCAGVIIHLLGLTTVPKTVVAVDGEPASRWQIATWARAHLGLAPPRPHDDPDDSRPGIGKRCRSDRLVAGGYRFRYPTFREGYSPLLAAG